jgi:hypothetical protein
MRGKFGRFLIEVTTPPMRALGFIVGKLYSIIFGRLDMRLAKKGQEKLASDIREELPFLLKVPGAEIGPTPGAPFPPAFDYAFITVSSGDLVLSFSRGQEHVSVYVAQRQSPRDGHELKLVLTLLDPAAKIQRTWTLYSLASVARLLEPRMDLLRKAFSEEDYPEFRKRLSEVEDYDRIVNRQFEAELNWRLYGR